MIKKIFILLVAIVSVLCVVVAMQPDDFRVERSITVEAAPDVVFMHVNDFHNWVNWSPWAKLDPAMQVTFDGPSSGVGAINGWKGNAEVGEGQSTILESRAGEFIKIKLEFIKPMVATNMSEFSFKGVDGKTLVTWNMSGKQNFLSKAVGLIMNCEKMVGDQFEQGLLNLKTISEASKL